MFLKFLAIFSSNVCFWLTADGSESFTRGFKLRCRHGSSSTATIAPHSCHLGRGVGYLLPSNGYCLPPQTGTEFEHSKGQVCKDPRKCNNLHLSREYPYAQGSMALHSESKIPEEGSMDHRRKQKLSSCFLNKGSNICTSHWWFWAVRTWFWATENDHLQDVSFWWSMNTSHQNCCLIFQQGEWHGWFVLHI